MQEMQQNTGRSAAMTGGSSLVEWATKRVENAKALIDQGRPVEEVAVELAGMVASLARMEVAFAAGASL